MKCPKCSYLGFDTGERCRNCGYDFSLISSDEPAAELTLRIDDVPATSSAWQDAVDRGLSQLEATAPPAPLAARLASSATALDVEPTQPPPSFRGAPALPLFGMAVVDDEPLIKVPSAPRPPLAVRRTPDSARLRTVPKAVERTRDLVLDFADQPVTTESIVTTAERAAPAAPPHLETSGAGRRLAAAAIDHGILLAIDAVVLYLTLRIALLTPGDWRALPLLPMLTFLGLLKLSYFTAFTCVGGQTIGKMAVRIRVVGDDDRPLDAPHATHRAVAGAISFLILGAGFVPVLFGADRRALHDRLAHTRVVTLPAA